MRQIHLYHTISHTPVSPLVPTQRNGVKPAAEKSRLSKKVVTFFAPKPKVSRAGRPQHYGILRVNSALVHWNKRGSGCHPFKFFQKKSKSFVSEEPLLKRNDEWSSSVKALSSSFTESCSPTARRCRK
eukprot:g62911.t1